MRIRILRLCAVAIIVSVAGLLLTYRSARAQNVNRVFEMRIYHTLPGRLPALQANFRDHNIQFLKKHGITSIGYWTPQDSPASDNTLIFIVAHDSREAAAKNWKEFAEDPEWQKFAKASQVDGKIIDKVETTFMIPTDYSPIK
jgi:hypothetical protein